MCIHLIDRVLLAIAALVIIATLWFVPGMTKAPGQIGLVRTEPAEVTIEIWSPAHIRIARKLSTGPLQIETSDGLEAADLIAVERFTDHVTLLLTARLTVDRHGRRFFDRRRVRRGATFRLSLDDVRVDGRIAQLSSSSESVSAD